MKKRIFTLFILSFLLSGALSNVKAQPWAYSTNIGSNYIVETSVSRDYYAAFGNCSNTLTINFGGLFNVSASPISDSRDTILVLRNGVEVVRFNTASMSKTVSLSWGSALGSVRFSVIYRWAGGASLSVGTFEYTVYANPTVSTNFDGVSLYDYFYGRTTQFPGKVEFTIRGGSPDLEYSLTNFAQNTTPRRVYANGYTGSQTIALTPLDIQNLIPGSTIQFNEPHGCGAIMPVFGVPEVPEPLGGIIQRPIYIDKSVEAHATIIPGTGIHYVPSGKNFVFKVIPKEADADAKVTVTTDRKILPPEGEEDITYKIDDEGIWTVTIRGIQEALNVNISFAAPNSATGTAVVEGDQVWGTAGAAYITSATAGSVRIYGGTGALVKTVTYSSGTTAIPLPAGFYILSKGGSNYKVIVK